MSGPVLAFDVKATRGGTLTRIAPVPHSAPAPAVPVSDKATERADLVSTYAGLLGASLQRADLMEAARRSADADLTDAAIINALSGAGLVVRSRTLNAPDPAAWPGLANLRDNRLVLVLEQTDDTVIVYDSTRPDRRRELPLMDFTDSFTGGIIRADVAVATLDARHADRAKPGHWFWSEVLSHRRVMAEVGLGSLVANMLAVAIALFSLQVYDRVIPHQSLPTLWVLAIGAGIAMLMEASLRIARARLMDSAGRQIDLTVQTLLMQRLMGMRAGGATGQTPSANFAAIREFSAIREFFTASTMGTLTDLPFIVLFLALVASIGGPVVWVLVIGGVLMVLPALFVQKKMMQLTLATQGASTKASRLLQEAVYDLDTIKAHRGEGRFARLWGEFAALSALSTSEQRNIATALTHWSQGVQQATYIAAVVMGAYLVFDGRYTVGTIIAVGILTSRTLGPLTGLAGTLARWTNVKAALTALDGIVAAEQDSEPGRSYLRRDILRGDFDIAQLTYHYDPEAAAALDLPGLAISAGQRIAVLGNNGSGKSTFLRLLSGLHRPTAGRVLLDGIDMGQLATRDLRRNIGYLGQEVRLFSGTLRDNLNLSQLERDDDRLLAALDFAGLGPTVRNHPKGLDLDIRDGGAGLSVGQRQSIGWARLWLQDPAICLLDEPTAALDSTLEADLVARLDGWLQGRTTLIATHRLPILQLVGRVIILQDGRLAVDGPRDDVLAYMQNRKAG